MVRWRVVTLKTEEITLDEATAESTLEQTPSETPSELDAASEAEEAFVFGTGGVSMGTYSKSIAGAL